MSSLRLKKPSVLKKIQMPTIANIFHLFKECLMWLLPSFISIYFLRRPGVPQSTSGITALDGLRGIACLIVFNEHFSSNFSKAFNYGYGTNGHSTFVQRPFIRTLWAGSAMVAIFFVISGYVLSHKPLRLIRARKFPELNETLSSSAFRRSFRLYAPTVVAVMICAILSWMGIFDAATAVAKNAALGLQFHEAPPPRFDSFFDQMADATEKTLHMFYIFSWGRKSITPGDYDVHLWTIPVEWRASMALFMTLFVMSKRREFQRLICVGLMIASCWYCDQRETTLFLCGMLLAELDMIRNVADGKNNEKTGTSKDGDRKFWLILFVVGFYLTSAPIYSADATYGYQFLVKLIPTWYEDRGIAIQACGAVMLVWAVANSNHLKPVFTNRIAAYLGKISYALYIVHGNVLKSLLYVIMPWLYQFTGGFQYMFGFVGAWMMGMALILPVTLWLSDIFWRSVDLPSVSFARWFEKCMTIDLAEEGTEMNTPRMV